MIKEYTEQELLDKIPSGWNDLTLKMFVECLSTNQILESDDVSELKETFSDTVIEVENSIRIISMFLGMDKKIIEQFPISTITKMNTRLSFLVNKPEPLKNPKYKWITKIEEPDYNSFIVYLKVKEQLEKGSYDNIKLLVKQICLDELTDEQLDNLPMDEVETGFFLLRKSLMKYLKSMKTSLNKVILKERMRTKMRKFIPFKKISKK